VRLHWQSWWDHNRRSYLLTFPDEVAFTAAQAWARSFAGALKRPRFWLAGLPSLVFELEADARGIRHRLKVPWPYADVVSSQLGNLITGLTVIPEEHWEPIAWTAAWEIGETHAQFPLRIVEPESLSSSILGSVQPLKDAEAVVMQWVVAPEPPQRPPSQQRTVKRLRAPWPLSAVDLQPADKDEIAARRAKLAETTFQAVGRIAGHANTEERAKHLVFRVYAALASTDSADNSFKVRRVRRETVIRRIERGATPLLFPCQLNVTELVSLAMPVGKLQAPGLPTSHTRHLSAHPDIPHDGIVLAVSTFPGAERRLALSPDDLTKHLHVIGQTGTGKSTVLENVAAQIMQQGLGMLVIEPKGELIEAILNLVPRERIADVILLDPSDTERPIGLNLLSGMSPTLATSYLLGVFDKLYGTGIQTGHILRHTIRTIAEQPGMTLYDVALILDDPDFRDQVTRQVRDESLQRFWTRFDNLSRAEQDTMTEPVMRRLAPFLMEELRLIFGQANGLDMTRVLAEGKILLVNLSRGRLGDDTASLLGSMVIAQFWQAVQSRAERTPFPMLADEFGDFVKLPTSFAEILAQARSRGVPAVLAHQHLGQIRDIKEDVLANARNKLVLQVGADDAHALGRELAPSVEANHLQHLGKYQAIARLVCADQVMPPVTAQTLSPPKPVGLGRAVKAASRQQWARPRPVVEADLLARRRGGDREAVRRAAQQTAPPPPAESEPWE
jgi:hypothetical protein